MARRGRLKRRLRALGKREDEGRRDLGVLILDMYRREELDLEALGERAMEVASLGGEIDGLRGQLGEPAGAPQPTERQFADAPEPVDRWPVDAPDPIPEGGAAPPAATLPPGEEGDEDEPEGPSPAHAMPSDPAVEDLTAQVEDAERRAREAADDARREDEESGDAEILALEKELDDERQRVAEALDGARTRLEAAEDRSEREQEAEAAAARAEAAEWLRGQAKAMRREAERQVREELGEHRQPEAAPATAGSSGPETGNPPRDDFDQRLAVQTSHLREQLRLQREESEHRLRETEERAETELSRRTAELRAERDAAIAQLHAAERQLDEPEPEPDPEPNPQAETEPRPTGGRLDLNSASFEELRQIGMSVTQAHRVIAYRDKVDGFGAVDDLNAVPGFSRALLADLKQRLDA